MTRRGLTAMGVAGLFVLFLLGQWMGGRLGVEAAPTPVEPVPYDLTRVVERALSHHLAVRMATLHAAVVERQTTQQQAALRPTLSVSAARNWFETPGPDPDGLTSPIDSDKLRELVNALGQNWSTCVADLENCAELNALEAEFDRQLRGVTDQLRDGLPQRQYHGQVHNVTVNGSVPLWRSPLQRAVADAAQWQRARTSIDRDEAAAGAILQSMDAYFAVLRAEAAQAVAELSLAEAESRLAEVTSRVDAGTATNIDRLQVEAERHGAQAQLLQARGEVTAARMVLNSVLGFDLNVPLQVAPPASGRDTRIGSAGNGGLEGSAPLAIDIEGSSPSSFSGGGPGLGNGPAVRDALTTALQSATVQQAYNDWHLAGAAATIAAEQAKPGLKLFGTYKWPEVELTVGMDRHGYLGGSVAWSQTHVDADADSAAFLGGGLGGSLGGDDTPSWFAGIEWTWTIFDGGQRRAEVEAARLQAEQAGVYYEHVAEQARTDVLAAYVRWQAALAALTGVGQGVAAAEEGVNVAQQLAKAGAATQTAVLQAELGLARAKQAHLDALHGAHMAHGAYLHAAGQLVPYWQNVLGTTRR